MSCVRNSTFNIIEIIILERLAKLPRCITGEWFIEIWMMCFNADREQVRMNHQEFDGLPLWLLWCLSVATFLVYVGGMMASGPLKRISVADAPQYVYIWYDYFTRRKRIQASACLSVCLMTMIEVEESGDWFWNCYAGCTRGVQWCATFWRLIIEVISWGCWWRKRHQVRGSLSFLREGAVQDWECLWAVGFVCSFIYCQ